MTLSFITLRRLYPAHRRQMHEWTEGEDDPDSYEIPKLEPDMPLCLRGSKYTGTAAPLATFAFPAIPRLEELIETTIELHRVSHLVERPEVDEDLLQRERDNHSLGMPVPAVLLSFRAGDAVMACFDDECEFWGQETPEPNLIIPLWPDDPPSVRQALFVVETLMRVLVLTVRINNIRRPRRSPHAIQYRVRGELELKLYQAVLLHGNERSNRQMATVHSVVQKDRDGAPLLGAGGLLSTASLRELTWLLGTGCPVEFLPPQVVARTPDMLAWWTPAAVRPMFLRAGSELGDISGKPFPHPALLFVVRNSILYVRVLPARRRPAQTRKWRQLPTGTLMATAPFVRGPCARRSR